MCISSYFNSHKVQAAVYKPKNYLHASMFEKLSPSEGNFPGFSHLGGFHLILGLSFTDKHMKLAGVSYKNKIDKFK